MGANVMTNEIIGSSVIVGMKYIVLFFIPFVEPQLAGILGGIAYLMVRHELKMATLTLKSILIVMFFGWLGAWGAVNIIAEHIVCPDVWVQIFSATVGFLSYDAMMAFGANTTSVLGFFTDILKKTIQKGVDKWNF